MVKIANSWGDLLTKKYGKKPIKLWQLIMISPILMVLFGFGIWSMITTSALVDNGLVVPGKITDVEVNRDSDGTDYSPIFTFITQAGETYTKTSNFSSSSRPQIGKTIEVIYRAENPAKSARINSFMELWFLPFLLLTLAVIVEMTLVINYLMGRNQKAAGNENRSESDLLTSSAGAIFNGETVRSRYWQTVNEGGQRQLEVQYIYQEKTYKVRSQSLSEKQLRKLVPGQAVRVRVPKDNPAGALVLI